MRAEVPVREQAPSVLHCGFLIAAVKLMLKVRGFDATTSYIRRRVAPVPTAGWWADDSLVKRTEYAVAMAAALYPGRALCLERSLVLYYLLRRRGIAVTYCQGVQPYPFLAHAWVEFRGQPINDVAEHVQLFARLPEEIL
jgi:hypothetical protein